MKLPFHSEDIIKVNKLQKKSNTSKECVNKIQQHWDHTRINLRLEVKVLVGTSGNGRHSLLLYCHFITPFCPLHKILCISPLRKWF